MVRIIIFCMLVLWSRDGQIFEILESRLVRLWKIKKEGDRHEL